MQRNAQVLSDLTSQIVNLEGHPHTLTTFHKPLASTSTEIAASIYNSKGCSLTAWQGAQNGRISAILGFCAFALAMGTPNIQEKVNQMRGQTLSPCVI